MPEQTGDTRQPSQNAGKEKRKPVRRDPEKRRQQNVQAQRKYREKLRKRLDDLEALAEAAARSRGIEIPPLRGTTSPDSNSQTENIANALPNYDTSDLSISGSSVATPGECQPLISQPEAFPSTLGTWDPTIPIPQLANTPSLLGFWDATTHDTHGASSCALDLWDATTQPLPPNPTTTALAAWNTITNINPSLLTYDKAQHNLIIDCGCPNPHISPRTQDPTISYTSVRILKVGPRALTADPYTNNLRLEAVCTINALYALGMHIGITEEMMCDDDSLSPFFRSHPASANDATKSTMISSVQRVFKTLKPDLRPSKEQITIEHHPCIDILPFPTLRNNLIRNQEVIDDDEFFHDMLTGLVCWGGAGVGRRDQHEAGGMASTGTPWDARSWEAKVWFLKKYWDLLGGEEGELVSQSEWWRSIRGDDRPLVEVY